MTTTPPPVHLRAGNDKYLSAEYGGSIDPRQPDRQGWLALTASREAAGPFETFRLVPVDPGHVAIQVHNGCYLTAERGGGSFLRTDALGIGPWETWTRVPFSDSALYPGRTFSAFRAPDNIHYLSLELPDPRGEVHARKSIIGPWETFEVIGEPQVVLTPRLRQRGHCFETVDGARWTGIETTDFHLFGRYENGEDIAPVVQQRVGLGFNLLRVGTRYDLRHTPDGRPINIGRCTLADHPTLYDDLPQFARWCAARGVYLELLSYFGREDFDPTHWNRLGDVLLDEPNVFLSLVNENDQAGNHIDLSPYAKHPGILCSRGSHGSQMLPPGPHWDYVELHTNGAPYEQRKIGHNAWEINPNLPAWSSETSRYPDVGMWTVAGSVDQQEQLAYDSTRASVLLAAGSGCFHSVNGKNSTLWDEPATRVAAAWANGARGMSLDWQDDPYQHRDDIEQRNDPTGYQILRVYQRGAGLATVRCNTGERREGATG